MQYQKRRENGATEESVTEVGQGRQPAKEDWREKGDQMSKGGEVEQFDE